jgi:hypothetical protein
VERAAVPATPDLKLFLAKRPNVAGDPGLVGRVIKCFITDVAIETFKVSSRIHGFAPSELLFDPYGPLSHIVP